MVRGRARYIDDLTPADALHLRLVRSPLAHADILEIDASALRDEFPGALLFTGDDIGALGVRAVQDYPEAQASYQPLLARGKVRFVGEPVAAVLTDDPYTAEDAAELVLVDYQPLAVLADVDAALTPGAPLLHDGWESNLFVERQMKGGDLDAVRARADHVIRRSFRNQRPCASPSCWAARRSARSFSIRCCRSRSFPRANAVRW